MTVAIAWAILSGPTPTTGTVARGPDVPESFEPVASDFGRRSIKAAHRVAASDRWIAAPWPFVEPAAVFACAEPGLSIVGSGGRFAALNGHTSGLLERYRVRTVDGRDHAALGTGSNLTLRSAGLVRTDASDAVIGEWWGAMNTQLSKTCR